jgi:hypothetical protein
MLKEINFLALGSCALLSLALGWLWYGPLFGRAWRKLSGVRAETALGAYAVRGSLVRLLSSFVQAAVLAALLALTGGDGWRFGLALGATCGIGLVATTLYGDDVFERRPFNLSCINAGYRIVWFAAAGAILGAWS